MNLSIVLNIIIKIIYKSEMIISFKLYYNVKKSFPNIIINVILLK